MFQGNTFRLNMFVIALFTSDVGFNHVSSIVVNFGFALRCCVLVTVAIKFCCNVLRQYSAFYPSPIITVVFLRRPIF